MSLESWTSIERTRVRVLRELDCQSRGPGFESLERLTVNREDQGSSRTVNREDQCSSP